VSFVPAQAGERVGVSSSSAPAPGAGDSTDRLIVKLRDPGERDPDRRIGELGGRAGERLSRWRAMSGGSHVVRLSRALSRAEARALAQRLSLDPAVAFVEPDLRMYPLFVPNDVYYPYQWNLFEPAGGINLPAAWDVTVGAIARYQDGQPFARLLIVPDLVQGPDIVRATVNGGPRFTFTATLDLRAQKSFEVAGRQVSVFADVYNLLNLAEEVEEREITGAGFRTPTAFQPPRTARIGARVAF